MWYKIKLTLSIVVAMLFIAHMSAIYQKSAINTQDNSKKITHMLAGNQDKVHINWY